MTIRAAIAMCGFMVLTGGLAGRALAISTLEDTLRDLPRITRTPSTWPPNNSVNRGPLRRGGDSSIDGNNQTSDGGPDANVEPNNVPAAAAPYAIALSEGPRTDKDFLCAGALIAPDWVLTAAHCIDAIGRRWPNETQAFAFAQTANLAEPGRRFVITRVAVHPQYDARTLKNDIAMVQINASGDAGTPIPFEGPRAADQVGEIVSIFGWGSTTAQSDRQYRQELQIIQSAVLDDGLCFGAANFPELRGKSVFCARTLLKHHDTCFRFGGSPIVIYDDTGRQYLAGLVSWPAKCPNDGRKPNVFLDVQAYVPWIKGVINASK